MSLSQEERADKFLAQAEAVAALGIWDVVANRIFYAAFHAVSALLINDHYEVRSHKGAGLMFGQKYVIPGMAEMSGCWSLTARPHCSHQKGYRQKKVISFATQRKRFLSASSTLVSTESMIPARL